MERLRIPFDQLAHILYLFVLGVQFYRTRRYSNTTLKTAQRLYLLFRQAIYDVFAQQLTQIILDGEIEVDESMYVATVKESADGANWAARRLTGIHRTPEDQHAAYPA